MKILIVKRIPATIYITPDSSGPIEKVAEVGDYYEFIGYLTVGNIVWSRILVDSEERYLIHGPDDWTENISVVTEKLYSMLVSEGVMYFLNNKKETFFEGQIDPEGNFVLNQDFNMGDIVTVKNEVGLGGKCRVTELLYSHDGESGIRIYPTFRKV